MSDIFFKAVITVALLAMVLGLLHELGNIFYEEIPQKMNECMMDNIELIHDDNTYDIVYSYCKAEAENAGNRNTLERD